MNKTGFFLKVCLIIGLLQGITYCSAIDQSTRQTIDQKVQEYRSVVGKASFRGNVFVNYTEIWGKTNVCQIFNDYFASDFFSPKDFRPGWVFLAHVATLAQDSPKCWNAQIRKIENIIKPTKPGRWTQFKGMLGKQKSPMPAVEIQNSLKEAKFLYEIFLDSAARSYVFMEGIYQENKKQEQWWHLHKKLMRTPSDFYILAVLHSIKIHMPEEFENIKNDFLKNFRSYLQKSNMSDSDIDNIMKQIEKKSTPSYLSRYWKWWLAAGLVTTVGVTYWIYQNEEAKKQIGAIPGKIAEKLFGAKKIDETKPDIKPEEPKSLESENIENKALEQKKPAENKALEKDLTEIGNTGNKGQEPNLTKENIKTEAIKEPGVVRVIEREFENGTKKEIINLNPETEVMESKIVETKDLDTGVVKERVTTQYSELTGEPVTTKHEVLNKKTGKLEDESYQIEKNDTFRGNLDRTDAFRNAEESDQTGKIGIETKKELETQKKPEASTEKIIESETKPEITTPKTSEAKLEGNIAPQTQGQQPKQTGEKTPSEKQAETDKTLAQDQNKEIEIKKQEPQVPKPIEPEKIEATLENIENKETDLEKLPESNIIQQNQKETNPVIKSDETNTTEKDSGSDQVENIGTEKENIEPEEPKTDIKPNKNLTAETNVRHIDGHEEKVTTFKNEVGIIEKEIIDSEPSEYSDTGIVKIIKYNPLNGIKESETLEFKNSDTKLITTRQTKFFDEEGNIKTATEEKLDKSGNISHEKRYEVNQESGQLEEVGGRIHF